MSCPDVEPRFLRQQARCAFPGGQLVIHRGDERLLDLAIGTARGWRGAEAARVPVTPETLTRLEERGLIDVNAPVKRYFPDFVAPDVTLLDVITHRLGVTSPERSRRCSTGRG